MSQVLQGNKPNYPTGRSSSIRFRQSMPMLPSRFCLSNFVAWSVLVLAVVISHCEAQEDSANCRSIQTCSQCIQQNSQCAWCAEPTFGGDFRCDKSDKLHDSCPPQHFYQSVSRVRVTENVASGTYEPQLGKVREIEPQQVHVLIRPGETVSFPLKYYHSSVEEKDVYILNSNTEPQGVTLSYHVDCKGVHQPGQLCRQIQNAETVTFNISVSIRDCNSNAAISIGIAAVREVVALYVRPQCGCDCEKPDRQETRSGHCSGQGTLTCGVCNCDDPRKGGSRCECDLPQGVSSSQLEAQCRESADKPLCSSHGYCACGNCACNPTHSYSGKYCECGNVECPAVNGVQCNGRGQCACGECRCDDGWSGPNCECNSGTDACAAVDGSICSGQGTCLCNKCKCDEGHEGDYCEQSPATPIPTSAEPEEPPEEDHSTQASPAEQESTPEDHQPSTDEGDASTENEEPNPDTTTPIAEEVQPPKAEPAAETPPTGAAIISFNFKWPVVFAVAIVVLIDAWGR